MLRINYCPATEANLVNNAISILKVKKSKAVFAREFIKDFGQVKFILSTPSDNAVALIYNRMSGEVKFQGKLKDYEWAQKCILTMFPACSWEPKNNATGKFKFALSPITEMEFNYQVMSFVKQNAKSKYKVKTVTSLTRSFY